jgi:hypothetical protein
MINERVSRTDSTDSGHPAAEVDADNEQAVNGSTKQSIQLDDGMVAEMEAEVENEWRAIGGNVAAIAGDVMVHGDAPDRELLPPADEARATSDLPVIELTGLHMHEVTAAALSALAALNTPPWVFSQLRSLVRIIKDDAGDIFLEHHDIDTLRGDVDRSAYYVKTSGGRTSATIVSDKCLKDALGRRRFSQFPALKGIVHVPFLRPDGTIHDAPGYDPVTQLYYSPSADLTLPPIPEQPDAAQIASAAQLLQEPFEDFPFASPCDRTNAVSLLLGALLRPSIPGPVLMALITSPTPGTGKSLLTNVITRLATGKASEAIMLTNSESENQKRITSVFMAGTTVICLDNLTGMLRSASVARVITEPKWRCRLLGQNREIDVPVCVTVMATGNNTLCSTEIARRSFPIRLDTHDARRGARETVFRHPDLDEWAIHNRGAIIAAALTLARAYFLAGKPSAPHIPATGNFNRWARLIGGMLAFAGIDGFLGNLNTHYGQGDDEQLQWERLLRAIRQEFHGQAVSATQIASLDAEFFPEWLAEYYNKPSFPVKLGKAMANIIDRPFGSEKLRVEKAGQVHGKTAWRVLSSAGECENTSSIVQLRPAPIVAPAAGKANPNAESAPNVR